MAETAATAMGYGPEVLGFEGVRKWLGVNTVKNNVDTLQNQGQAFAQKQNQGQAFAM